MLFFFLQHNAELLMHDLIDSLDLYTSEIQDIAECYKQM